MKLRSSERNNGRVYVIEEEVGTHKGERLYIVWPGIYETAEAAQDQIDFQLRVYRTKLALNNPDLRKQRAQSGVCVYCTGDNVRFGGFCQGAETIWREAACEDCGKEYSIQYDISWAGEEG